VAGSAATNSVGDAASGAWVAAGAVSGAGLGLDGAGLTVVGSEGSLC
jgi:hypothetical protein